MSVRDAPRKSPQPRRAHPKSLRLSAARRLLYAAFQVLRPKRAYEPVEIGGRRFASKREAEGRWAAIAEAIRRYEARTILDVGCAEGWFLRRAAEDFGCFGLGVDAEDRRVLTGEIARLHDGVERVAVMKARLTPAEIRTLPACDIVLCLSVVHHVMRQGGRGAAEEFVQALATRARKALIFEMGTSEEKQLAWSSTLPEMPEGQEAFVRRLLEACGLREVRVIASTPGLHGDAPRLLFAAEPG
jgi:hypothetical protein